MYRFCGWFLPLMILLGPAAFAQDAPENQLKKLSLEELLDVNVTSVTRRAEPLRRTAAAVTVITTEDIRRSGATNIPEALRLVPGLQVARFNSSSWAISARGFNSTAANKMLVLVDGRTAYSPLFSGAFWDVQDLILDDIARIEVVRGPGATLWGTNAVNGIINIITKSAHQTKGTRVVLRGGNADDIAVGSVRVGAGLGRDTSYRAYGKYTYGDQMALANGGDAKDSTRLGLTGFRVDSTRGSNELTFEGTFYREFSGLLGRQDAKVLGGNLLGRWNRKLSNTSEIQVQMSYERMDRRVPLQSDFRQKIFDVDLQHHFEINERNNLVWGVSYRWNRDTTVQTPVLSFVPPERTYPLGSTFVQDEIALAGDRVKLLVGSKFEHNNFSGFEAQPSVRVSWNLKSEEMVWGAISRAVRSPSRFDSDIRFGPPVFQFVGNPDFKSEDLVAYELGYRSRPERRLSLDIAAFYNVYDSLRSLESRGQPQPGNIQLLNNLNANAYGGEVSANYDLLEWLRFSSGYSYFHKRLTMDPGHADVFNGTLEGNDPAHQFLLRGSADLSHGLEVDTTLRFVSSLPTPPVPRYLELDGRFGWSPTPALELSVIGRNLLDRQHPEFGPPSPFREEIKRNVYGRVAFRF